MTVGEGTRGDSIEGYVTLKIPSSLAKQIDRYMRSKELGYRSRAEFVSEAIRHWLLELGKLDKKKKPKK